MEENYEKLQKEKEDLKNWYKTEIIQFEEQNKLIKKYENEIQIAKEKIKEKNDKINEMNQTFYNNLNKIEEYKNKIKELEIEKEKLIEFFNNNMKYKNDKIKELETELIKEKIKRYKEVDNLIKNWEDEIKKIENKNEDINSIFDKKSKKYNNNKIGNSMIEHFVDDKEGNIIEKKSNDLNIKPKKNSKNKK